MNSKPQNNIKLHRDYLFAKMNFTQVQMKIIDTLISTLQPKATKFERQQINIADLQECYNKNMTRTDIDQLTDNLVGRYVKIDDKEKQREWAIPIFSYIFYDYKLNRLCFQFNNLARRLILDFRKNYLNLNLKHIFLLRSKHSIRLYKILKYYLNIKNNCQDSDKFIKIDLDDLYAMLGVKYDRFYNFKKRVLEPIKKEISDKTDLLIDYEVFKKHNKITGIVFAFVDQETKRKSPKKIANTTEKMLDNLHEKADKKQAKTTKKYQKKSDKIGVLRQQIELKKSYIKERIEQKWDKEVIDNDKKELAKMQAELDELT